MCARKYGRLTVGGTPEAMARRSHNTPLRNRNHVNGLRIAAEEEGNQSHLFPKEESYAECTTSIAAKVE